ncbi:MAG TPA: mechanosensitive ion channel family protein [Pseudomonadales bacterium]|nr:mechanosensitive ion channel family protein [Pseudomonadales bacterium]
MLMRHAWFRPLPSPALAFALASCLACTLGITSAFAEPSDDARTADPVSVIEAAPTELTDATIQARIEDIYAQIEALADVRAAVQEGVVTLSGQVSNEAQAQRALGLARRLQGIVTVEDRIERRLDVEGNVRPVIDQFAARLTRWLRAWPLVALSSLAFLCIAFAGDRLARWGGFWNRVAPNIFLAGLMAQATRIAFLVAGLVIALNLVGATTLLGTILGGAGVLGLTIAFAVRDALENYISSIMLSLRQPFRANDHVAINEREGRVVRLTSRSTILMTLEGNHLRIPNSTVYKAVILNYTRNPQRRFEFDLGIDAADDPIAAMSTGLEAIRRLEQVVDDPGPSAIIKTVGDSTIVIIFMAWMDQSRSDFWKIRSLAIKVVKDAIEQGGFTLPEPLYRVRLEGAGAQLAAPAGETDAEAAPRPAVTGTKRAATGTTDSTLLDVSPDRHLEEMIDDERSLGDETDLLDSATPIE